MKYEYNRYINTPSVNSESTEEPAGGGGGGSGSPGTPVEGMYFMHTDHLRSVTAITDPKGEMVASMDIDSGKSIISYSPYGEIDRKNSSGPDIFRYKYTTQQEDTETNLYYYKSRYYDSKLGRFLQADSVTNAESPMGLNHYMYTEGNPVKYRDPDGHRLSSAQGWALLGYLQGPSVGLTPEEGAMAGYAYGKGVDKKDGRNSNTGGKKNNLDAGKAWDTTLGNKGFGGWLGKSIGWDRAKRWWQYHTKPYEGDWEREAIKDVGIANVCSEYGKNSDQCLYAKWADALDTREQQHQYDRRKHHGLNEIMHTIVVIVRKVIIEYDKDLMECGFNYYGGGDCKPYPQAGQDK